MTDYVIMPKEDYQAICNAVRNKTDKAELIKSGDMASEIGGIDTIPKTAAIDYSDFDNGTFKETLDNGDTLTYAVEFADGLPSKVIAPNGKVILVEFDSGLTIYIPETTLNGFEYSNTSKRYSKINYDETPYKLLFNAFSPNHGDRFPCVVMFDGERHDKEMLYNVSDPEMGAIMFEIGNRSFIGSAYPNSGENFCIAISPRAIGVYTTIEGESHSIGLEA